MVEIRFPFSAGLASLYVREDVSVQLQEELTKKIFTISSEIFKDFNHRILNSTAQHFSNSPIHTSVEANDVFWDFLVFCRQAHAISKGKINIFPEATNTDLSEHLDYNFTTQTITKLAPVSFAGTLILPGFVLLQIEYLVNEILKNHEYALLTQDLAVSKGNWELEFTHPITDSPLYLQTTNHTAIAIETLQVAQDFSTTQTEATKTSGVIVHHSDLATATILAKVAKYANHRLDLVALMREYDATIQLLLNDGSISQL